MRKALVRWALAGIVSASIPVTSARDAGAVTVTLATRLLASDGTAGDSFGTSTAASGNTVVIGAPYDSDNGAIAGSAYVFVQGVGFWSQQQILLPADGIAQHPFGYSVAVSGDTALLGAPSFDGTTLGAAYVFVRSGASWSQQQKLVASGQPGDSFGAAVALDGDTALVGARGDSTNGSQAGAAYVFLRSGGVWSLQQQILAADGQPSDNLGWSAALSGNTALLGAPGASANGVTAGAAYVFTRSGGSWTLQAEIGPADAAAGLQFGTAVSLDVDTAFVGAPGDGSNGASSGSAYVYLRTGVSWSQKQKLLASDGVAGDSLGSAVSVSGDTALVGAPGASDVGTSAGATYAYTRIAATWSKQQKVLPTGTATASGAFGGAVAVSGFTAVAGQSGYGGLGVNSGSAFVSASPAAAVPALGGGGAGLLALGLIAAALARSRAVRRRDVTNP